MLSHLMGKEQATILELCIHPSWIQIVDAFHTNKMLIHILTERVFKYINYGAAIAKIIYMLD